MHAGKIGTPDDGVTFGTRQDKEGRIWLNPQAWSILGGAASAEQREKMLAQVDEQLSTPYGVAMFAPQTPRRPMKKMLAA